MFMQSALTKKTQRRSRCFTALSIICSASPIETLVIGTAFNRTVSTSSLVFDQSRAPAKCPAPVKARRAHHLGKLPDRTSDSVQDRFLLAAPLPHGRSVRPVGAHRIAGQEA